MKRRNLFVPAGLVVSFLLGGCSILPEQTVEHPNVVVEAVEETSYNLAQVERGDIYLTQKLFFLYTQTKDEAVAFETGGRRVAGVYAKAGDTVKKGQLLAELDGEDLQTELDSYYYQKEYYELLNSQAKELYDYDDKALQSRYDAGELTKEEKARQEAQLKQSLTDTTEENEDALTIIDLRIEELEAELAECRIYAGIDGVVTYVLPRLEGSTSEEGVTVYRIINSDECLFRLEDPEYGDQFELGQPVHVQVSDDLGYDTTVKRIVDASGNDGETAETDSGQDAAAGKQYTVYLEPDELDAALAVGTRCYMKLTLDERHDVLYLPNSCIYTADDQSYVFVEDADGMKRIQNITVGMKGGSCTEILDGLGEGDVVIRR